MAEAVTICGRRLASGLRVGTAINLLPSAQRAPRACAVVLRDGSAVLPGVVPRVPRARARFLPREPSAGLPPLLAAPATRRPPPLSAEGSLLYNRKLGPPPETGNAQSVGRDADGQHLLSCRPCRVSSGVTAARGTEQSRGNALPSAPVGEVMYPSRSLQRPAGRSGACQPRTTQPSLGATCLLPSRATCGRRSAPRRARRSWQPRASSAL